MPLSDANLIAKQDMKEGVHQMSVKRARARRRIVRVSSGVGSVARVTNEARTGTTSGILNINIQIPVQVGANAQNLRNSDNNSTTVI